MKPSSAALALHACLGIFALSALGVPLVASPIKQADRGLAADSRSAIYLKGRLHAAVIRRDTDELREALLTVPVDELHDGITALDLAAGKRFYGTQNQVPIDYFCEPCALMLVAAGADPEGRDRLSPLVKAIEHAADELAQKLLEAGANPDARGTNGDPALTLAFTRVNDATFALMLSKGADVSGERTQRSLPPSQRTNTLASAPWKVETVAQLERLALLADHEPDVVVRRRSLELGLVLAGESRASTDVAIRVIDWLLEQGASINAMNTAGQSALIRAVARRPRDIDAVVVRHLLEKGIDPKIKDGQGRTALDWFMFVGKNTGESRPDILDLLTKANAPEASAK